MLHLCRPLLLHTALKLNILYQLNRNALSQFNYSLKLALFHEMIRLSSIVDMCIT